MSRTEQDVLEKTFVEVGSALGDVLMGVLPGWQRVSDGADRHGAWEWTVHRRTDDLDRYVVVAAVPRDGLDGAVVFHVEVWVGAQRGPLFRRVLLGEGEATAGGIGTVAQDLLADAEDRVMALAEEDLRGTSALR